VVIFRTRCAITRQCDGNRERRAESVIPLREEEHIWAFGFGQSLSSLSVLLRSLAQLIISGLAGRAEDSFRLTSSLCRATFRRVSGVPLSRLR
jgi:hypothetical protein